MTRPLLVIGGPTGSGKSQLGVTLALKFAGEIINCDSVQVYRHFDIGTAKLPLDERRGVKHHLIDVADPAKGFTAGDFIREARAALDEIACRGKLPILLGGTGFYIRALIDGLSPGPERDKPLRTRLLAREERRPGSLHRLLRRLDPPSAARIHENDIVKLIRALEIRLLSSTKASEQPERKGLQGYTVTKTALFPPRDRLYERLDARCEQMLSGGLLEEVRQLLAAGVPRDAKPFGSIGYKEALAIVDSRLTFGLTFEAALAQMRRDTRRYAKRQMTWFRHETGVIPLPGFGDEPAIEEAALQIAGQLAKPTAA